MTTATHRLMTTADVARERGWHRATAHRWMLRMQALGKKRGKSVVWREGRTLVIDILEAKSVAEVTTEEQLRQALNRIALLEAAYADQDVRINGISRDMVDVKRGVHARRPRGAVTK